MSWAPWIHCSRGLTERGNESSQIYDKVVPERFSDVLHTGMDNDDSKGLPRKVMSTNVFIFGCDNGQQNKRGNLGGRKGLAPQPFPVATCFIVSMVNLQIHVFVFTIGRRWRVLF